MDLHVIHTGLNNTKQDVISMAVKIKLLNFGLFALLVCPVFSCWLIITLNGYLTISVALTEKLKLLST